MTAIHTPTTAPTSAAYDAKHNAGEQLRADRAAERAAERRAERSSDQSADRANDRSSDRVSNKFSAYDQSEMTTGKDLNFFDIAFARTDEPNPAAIDVYYAPQQTQTNMPKILVVEMTAGQNTQAPNNLNDFGKAFNFDPILNLATQATDQAILNSLDQAGQAELIGQLIGALPAEVINTGFEQFSVPAGIENYDILPTNLSPDAEVVSLIQPPIQPLKALRGQITPPVTTPAPNASAASNAADQASPALIATGLTPSQITELTAAQSDENVEQIESLDVTLISVLPALTPASAALNTGDTSDTLKRFKSEHGQIGQNGQISSSDLKALKDSINQLAPLDNAQTGNQVSAQSDGQIDLAAQAPGIELPFSALVEEGLFGEQDLTEFNKRNTATTSNRDLPFINGRTGADGQTGTGAASANTPNANAAQHAKNQEAATTQLVGTSTGMVPWDSLDEIGALGVSPEGLSLGQVLHNTAHTSPTLMHSHAAMPHQATQAIAAKLTQYANQKGEQELKLQLDPPELGRVKIVMLVGKDGGIKAHLNFDKPETFLMMQRDASQLEKSLAEAGLDMSDGGIEFSLSSDNSGENTGDGHDKNDSFGRDFDGLEGNMADGEDIEITTSKMDWYTDNSGTLRLDMMT